MVCKSVMFMKSGSNKELHLQPRANHDERVASFREMTIVNMTLNY